MAITDSSLLSETARPSDPQPLLTFSSALCRSWLSMRPSLLVSMAENSSCAQVQEGTHCIQSRAPGIPANVPPPSLHPSPAPLVDPYPPWPSHVL